MKLLIVSENPAVNEKDDGPFTNGYWRYFKPKLAQMGIPPADCGWVNVIQKNAGSVYAFTQREKKGSTTLMPGYAKAAYIRREFDEDLSYLRDYIQRVKPNLILAVGDLPLVALTHQNKMEFARGRVTGGVGLGAGFKILPVTHPRVLLGEPSGEPILLADLAKARRESAFPEMRRPQRWLHLRPSIEDLESFWQDHIAQSQYLSIDIETKGDIITCVGVAPSKDRVLVVPFFDEEKPDGNYWASPREELIAWNFIRRCLEAEDKMTLGQNFSYDAQYLLKKMGIAARNWRHDTMLLHHALQPEMRKGLGFLASIYTDELQWKFMHKRKSADKGGKKEDE